jgi:hypothetical protein
MWRFVKHTNATRSPLCSATPPCTKEQPKYCDTCNRQFLSEKCQNHVSLKVKGKLVCQWRQVCRNCSYLVTADSKHECFKKFCTFCNKKQPSGHHCYMAPLKPSKLSSRYMYAFFDTGCTQDFEKHDGSFEHVPNFMCSANVQQVWSGGWCEYRLRTVWKACPHVLARPRR